MKRLNIEVIRPCINECYADFKPFKNKILYALSGIKSVGREAILNVVNEREKNGEYKSLNDFIKRVNPKDINKLQLEGLAKAGAFDKLEKNRNSIIKSIPRLIQLNKSLWDEKSSNQNSLFTNGTNEDTSIIFKLSSDKYWSKNEMLMNEFHSIGFYMSDHPLAVYTDYFDKMKIVSFNNFIENKENTSLVAGTIMSIQEKKSSKGTPFAIVKFSDFKSEFELFLFSDLLVANRDILKAANSFVLTLQKEVSNNPSLTRRINIKKLTNLDEFTKQEYEKVTIEVDYQSDLNELQNILKENGSTKIEIKIKNTSKVYTFSLKNLRKFNIAIFNHIKNKEYVKKISF